MASRAMKEKYHGLIGLLARMENVAVAVDLAGYRMGGLNFTAREGGEEGGDGK